MLLSGVYEAHCGKWSGILLIPFALCPRSCRYTDWCGTDLAHCYQQAIELPLMWQKLLVEDILAPHSQHPRQAPSLPHPIYAAACY